MGKKDELFQNLLASLRRQISESFAPGDRLPSIRDLAAMHGVGMTTVQGALRMLHEQGLIRPARRVGWFRAGSPPTRCAIALRVGILSSRALDYWGGFPIYSALFEEARRRGISIVEVPNRHKRRPTPGRNRIELPNVPWNTFDVALLVEAEDTIAVNAAALRQHKVLSVDYDATKLGIDSVAFDDVEVGAVAARHFHELGHVRFAVTTELNDPGFAWDPNCLARRIGYESAIAQFGGIIKSEWRVMVPREHRPSAGPQEFVARAVSYWAAAPQRDRPTAFFDTSGASGATRVLIDELTRHRMHIPTEVSIVTATWSGQNTIENEMRITTVEMRLSNLAARAFAIAADLASEDIQPGSRPPRIVYAPALLVPGQSTTTAPRS